MSNEAEAHNVYRQVPPHAKYLTILLSYHSLREAAKLPPYQVKSITDTTFYKPTDWLSKEDVHAMCVSPQWSVTMVDFDYLAHFTGMAGLAGAVGVKSAVL
jgi:hypothetical protein